MKSSELSDGLEFGNETRRDRNTRGNGAVTSQKRAASSSRLSLKGNARQAYRKAPRKTNARERVADSLNI